MHGFGRKSRIFCIFFGFVAVRCTHHSFVLFFLRSLFRDFEVKQDRRWLSHYNLISLSYLGPDLFQPRRNLPLVERTRVNPDLGFE